MKLPLLVFYLVVLCWACIIGAEEDVNSMGDVTNLNEEYLSHYQDVPWKKSLSRIKKNIIIKSVMALMMSLLGKTVGSMVALDVLYLFMFTYGALTGKDTCPPDLYLESISGLTITNPTLIIKTIICYIWNTIDSAGRAIIKASIKFIPLVHKYLNDLDSSTSLPPIIHIFIQNFNVVYNLLKLLGYVE